MTSRGEGPSSPASSTRRCSRTGATRSCCSPADTRRPGLGPRRAVPRDWSTGVLPLRRLPGTPRGAMARHGRPARTTPRSGTRARLPTRARAGHPRRAARRRIGDTHRTRMAHRPGWEHRHASSKRARGRGTGVEPGRWSSRITGTRRQRTMDHPARLPPRQSRRKPAGLGRHRSRSADPPHLTSHACLRPHVTGAGDHPHGPPRRIDRDDRAGTGHRERDRAGASAQHLREDRCPKPTGTDRRRISTSLRAARSRQRASDAGRPSLPARPDACVAAGPLSLAFEQIRSPRRAAP
jgi:hypothetical protein